MKKFVWFKISVIYFLLLFSCNKMALAVHLKDPRNKIPFRNLPETVCALSTNYEEIYIEGMKNVLQKHHLPYRHITDPLEHFMKFGKGADPIPFCSANVLTSHEVITAAHCVYRLPKGEMVLECPGGLKRKVDRSKVHVYPGYPFNGHDMAIVSTKNSIGIEPANLVDSYKKFRTLQNNQCGVFGYGRNAHGEYKGRLIGSYKNGKHLKVLNSVQLNISSLLYSMIELGTFKNVELDDFPQILKVLKNDPSGQFIMNIEKQSSIRKGDSGGGYLCKDSHGEDYLLGVIQSYFSVENPKGEIYQNIFNAYPWIMKKLSHESPGIREKIKTKLKQIEFFRKKVMLIQFILYDQNLSPNKKINGYFDKIHLLGKKMKKTKNQKLKLFILNQLKKTYVLLIEKSAFFLEQKGIKDHYINTLLNQRK